MSKSRTPKSRVEAFARVLPDKIKSTGKWLYSLSSKNLAKRLAVDESELPQVVEQLAKLASKESGKNIRVRVSQNGHGSAKYTFYYHVPGWLGEALEWAGEFLPLAERLHNYIYPGQKPRIQTLASWAKKLKQSKKPFDELATVIDWLNQTDNPYIPSVWDVKSFLSKYPAIVKVLAQDQLAKHGIKLNKREKVTSVKPDRIITTQRIIDLTQEKPNDDKEDTTTVGSGEAYRPKEVYEYTL